MQFDVGALSNKIQSMSAKEIVLAMVEGLERPACVVRMRTFGHVGDNGICYGCAATNALARIAGINSLDPQTTVYIGSTPNSIVHVFEIAINDLRLGAVRGYNYYAKHWGFATLPDDWKPGPMLLDDYTPQDLAAWRAAAETLPAAAREPAIYLRSVVFDLEMFDRLFRLARQQSESELPSQTESKP